MKLSRLLLPALAGLVLSTAAQAQSLNLGQYHFAGAYDMPNSAFETSAVTYNWDRDTLVVLDDEGFDVVEISKTGVELGRIFLTGHPPQGSLNVEDTEGITYLGNNTYMIGQERNRNVFTFQTLFPSVPETINLTTQAHRNQLFGSNDNVGNSGLEGISYDPVTNSFLGVKEENPSEIYRFTFDPFGFQATTTTLFSPSIINSYGVADFADVQSLGTIPGLFGTGIESNFLVLSEASSRLLELDSNGNLLSSLDLTGAFSLNPADHSNFWAHEGVTVDREGNIYIVAEQTNNATSGRMFVFSPATAVPEPGTALLLTGAAALFAAHRRRARASSPAPINP